MRMKIRTLVVSQNLAVIRMRIHFVKPFTRRTNHSNLCFRKKNRDLISPTTPPYFQPQFSPSSSQHMHQGQNLDNNFVPSATFLVTGLQDASSDVQQAYFIKTDLLEKACSISCTLSLMLDLATWC